MKFVAYTGPDSVVLPTLGLALTPGQTVGYADDVAASVLRVAHTHEVASAATPQEPAPDPTPEPAPVVATPEPDVDPAAAPSEAGFPTFVN